MATVACILASLLFVGAHASASPDDVSLLQVSSGEVATFEDQLNATMMRMESHRRMVELTLGHVDWLSNFAGDMCDGEDLKKWNSYKASEQGRSRKQANNFQQMMALPECKPFAQGKLYDVVKYHKCEIAMGTDVHIADCNLEQGKWADENCGALCKDSKNAQHCVECGDRRSVEYQNCLFTKVAGMKAQCSDCVAKGQGFFALKCASKCTTQTFNQPPSAECQACGKESQSKVDSCNPAYSACAMKSTNWFVKNCAPRCMNMFSGDCAACCKDSDKIRDSCLV